MIKAWFDGDSPLDIRKGDIVKISRGIEMGQNFIRVSYIENISSGVKRNSRIEGVLMTQMPYDLDPPIIGKVNNVEVMGNGETHFDVITGIYTDDHIFVEAGNLPIGQKILNAILSNETSKYIKICDSYVSETTIKLFDNLSNDIEIMILCHTIKNLTSVKNEVSNLIQKGKKISIKTVNRSEIHGRYILTEGQGWTVDHSLDRFGSADSQLQKLSNNALVESNFDKRWLNGNIFI